MGVPAHDRARGITARPCLGTALITARCGVARAKGFTLIELLLVVALVLMLVSALVFNFSHLLRSNELQEGTTRLETLMRFARAQAANSGRKVQLVFDAQVTNTPAASTGEVRATWEPDPLGEPGCFADLLEAQWHVQEINELLQVESVKLLDSAGVCPARPSSTEEEMDESTDSAPAKTMFPITFYPDGSSDSAEIIVAARHPEEDQRMAVRLVGMTGAISRQLLASDFGEDTNEAAGPASRPGLGERGSVLPDSLSEPEVAPQTSTRSTTVPSRTVPPAPRAPVGETNSVDNVD
jgi:prepilin-type N-terminal cleavage/methylation domain-containing protein